MGSAAAAETMKPRAPCAKPPFTIGDVRKAIPAHCFNKSVLTSMAYLAWDVSIAYALFVGVEYASVELVPAGHAWVEWVWWGLYWVMAGCVWTGLWVIGHECGHHAFSDYAWLDNSVGLLLHSCLLVPFFSWKYSHRRHHANTNNMETDEVYIPSTLHNLPWFLRTLMANPAGRILWILITLLLGFPAYLLFNVTGRQYGRYASHFDPNGPIFSKAEKTQVLISDVALAIVFYGLHHLVSCHGLGWVMKVYGVPLLIVNAFFVLITYLHHTHTSLPHYASHEWDWLRGALSTCDRDFGILNYVFHHVTETHVAHHLFSTIPHYHAVEAAEAIKPVLGHYYQIDHTPILKALWREFRDCLYVEPDPHTQNNGVLWYKAKVNNKAH